MSLSMCTSCGGEFLPPRRAPLWPMCPACSASITNGHDPWLDPGADWSAYVPMPCDDEEPPSDPDRMMDGQAVMVHQRGQPVKIFRYKSELAEFEASHRLRCIGFDHARLDGADTIVEHYEVVE